jgi:hypothetical protein
MTKHQKIEEKRYEWQKAVELAEQTRQALTALQEQSAAEYRFPLRFPFRSGVLNIHLPLTQQEYDYILSFLEISREIMTRPPSDEDCATEVRLRRIWQAAHDADQDVDEKYAAYWDVAGTAHDDLAALPAGNASTEEES